LLCVLLATPLFVVAEEEAKTAKECAKLSNSQCSKSGSGCILQSATTCSGATASFCSKKSCGTKGTTCGKSNGVYYSFTGTCLPSGFASAKTSKCTCTTASSSTGGGVKLTCANLTYTQCLTVSSSCTVEIGLACNNLSYAFCRNVALTCQNNQTSACAQEPITGLFYKFTNQCVPNNWFKFPNTTACSCADYTTNTCPQCPPGYNCPANSTSVSACYPIGSDTTLPTTPSLYGFGYY